jgi:hypothetical protein
MLGITFERIISCVLCRGASRGKIGFKPHTSAQDLPIFKPLWTRLIRSVAFLTILEGLELEDGGLYQDTGPVAREIQQWTIASGMESFYLWNEEPKVVYIKDFLAVMNHHSRYNHAILDSPYSWSIIRRPCFGWNYPKSRL